MLTPVLCTQCAVFTQVPQQQWSDRQHPQLAGVAVQPAKTVRRPLGSLRALRERDSARQQWRVGGACSSAKASVSDTVLCCTRNALCSRRYLQGNALTGSIPESLGTLFNLAYLCVARWAVCVRCEWPILRATCGEQAAPARAQWRAFLTLLLRSI